MPLGAADRFVQHAHRQRPSAAARPPTSALALTRPQWDLCPPAALNDVCISIPTVQAEPICGWEALEVSSGSVEQLCKKGRGQGTRLSGWAIQLLRLLLRPPELSVEGRTPAALGGWDGTHPVVLKRWRMS